MNNHGEKISKIAKLLRTLDEGDMVEVLQELALYNAELVIDMKLAAESVIEGLEDISEVA